MPADEAYSIGDADDAPNRPSSLPKTQAEFFTRAWEKVRSKFPTGPGVYLFQDQAGRVIYIGKAKNLRSRAGSYFLAAAARGSADRVTSCARRTTSTSLRPRARSMRCSWKRGW